MLTLIPTENKPSPLTPTIKYLHHSFSLFIHIHFHNNQSLSSYFFTVHKDKGKNWKMESLSYAFTDHTNIQADDLFPEMTRKSFLNNQRLQTPYNETNNRPIKSLNSASSAILNSVMEFGTRFSSSTNDDKQFSLVSAKRAKITNLPSSVPTCQVLGCNKDLSCSKDYHRRHKVCDVHSKTPVVIVNGFEQRFCQQCSRFHRVAEFDEGKRSCRKRLAGHNERRRKPQFDAFLGSTYLPTNVSKTSLLFSSIIPSDFYDPQCNDPINNHSMKFSQSFMNSQSHPKHCPNTPLSVQHPLSVGSNSSCALSLLSPQSTPHPLLSDKNDRINLHAFQNSAIPNLRENISGNFSPMIFNASGVDQGLPFDPDEISKNIMNVVNRKSFPSSESSETVSLVELSLNLQRVEQQKYSGQVKLENRLFCNPAYT